MTPPKKIEIDDEVFQIATPIYTGKRLPYISVEWLEKWIDENEHTIFDEHNRDHQIIKPDELLKAIKKE
jgi:hypothetical protein